MQFIISNGTSNLHAYLIICDQKTGKGSFCKRYFVVSGRNRGL